MNKAALYALITAAAVAWGPAALAEESQAGKPPAETKPGATLSPDAPVAVVNGKPVRKAAFDRALQAYLRNFRQMTGGMHGDVSEPNEKMKAEVLNQLIDRELLFQEGAKHPVDDLDQRVDQELERIRQRFPSAEEFQRAYESQGLTEERIRELLGEQLTVRNYVEQTIMPGVRVGDAEVSEFYKENEPKFAVPEQVQCSHILIRVDPEASAEAKEAARKKAEDLRARSLAGEDFAALAKEHSEDPGSAAKGGDLGFFTRERMVAPFAEAAFALKVGEISPVVETQFGYHVIKMTDRKEAGKQSLEEVAERIRSYLESRKLDEAVQAKVAELRKGAKIEVVAPHL
ncbi:MAG: peptidylprolyl isomerase [Deferrisomatales bacterium]